MGTLVKSRSHSAEKSNITSNWTQEHRPVVMARPFAMADDFSWNRHTEVWHPALSLSIYMASVQVHLQLDLSVLPELSHLATHVRGVYVAFMPCNDNLSDHWVCIRMSVLEVCWCLRELTWVLGVCNVLQSVAFDIQYFWRATSHGKILSALPINFDASLSALDGACDWLCLL